MSLFHLDHFNSPFVACVCVCVSVYALMQPLVKQFWKKDITMQGFNPGTLSFPDCFYRVEYYSHLPHFQDMKRSHIKTES